MKTINQLSVLAAMLVASTATAQEGNIKYNTPMPIQPPSYVCYKAPNPIVVDGKMTDEEWADIPWTDEFRDIEGDIRPKPHFSTRAKMTYDEKGMYFAAYMKEPHVWGTILKHDAVIFHDNDFEIFLDPSGDTHNYLEYEMNALNTDWDLYLSKPYRDGPVVMNGFEFAGHQNAVHIDGTLNDPSDVDTAWSVEVFFTWESIYQVMKRDNFMPVNGQQIRVNFSRVEWTAEAKDGKYVKIPIEGEDRIREYNWVWAPTGEINIHKPEYWGFVQFSDIVAGKGTASFSKNSDEQTKETLRYLYYRQTQYKGKMGEYAKTLSALKPSEISAEAAKATLSTMGGNVYEITLKGTNGNTWAIRQDGLVWKTK